MPTTYEFDWDAKKAEANARKHGVRFEAAMTVFRDPLALTVYDEEHGEGEERWVTIGRTEGGQMVVVIHTFIPTGSNSAKVRLISAREPTNREREQYEEG